MSVESDPRWQKFNKDGYPCSCGQKHIGLFPIHIEVPLGWPHAKTYEPDSALRMVGGDFLSDGYSVLKGHFAYRCRLHIPIAGAPPWAFTYTVWAGITPPDFEEYVAAKKANKLRKTVGYRVRIVNRLSGHPDTNGLLGTAFQSEDGQWPQLLVHGPQDPGHVNHPLLREQDQGIGMDRVLELFAVYGHDMRAVAR